MYTKEMIERLKEEMKNPASNAVLTVFATRQRARGNINLSSLHQRMIKEGFTYDSYEYIPVLQCLASLGLGELITSSQGKVRGLKNIKVRLQSIGKAAFGEDVSLTALKLRRRFKNLPESEAFIQPAPPRSLTTSGLSLEFFVGGKPVKIPVPSDLTTKEIASLITMFKVS